jgi:dTDP-4-amino-4,6-dideoxygalactose transaminase
MKRRSFVGAAAAAGLQAAPNGKPAILGGDPVRKAPFPSWPKFDARDEAALLDVLRSGRWNRLNGSFAERFEKQYAELLGAPHVLAAANGTSALITALNGLGVGPGDEVLVPPYTFVATINVVLMQHALPVFVDTDLETFQMDPAKIEAQMSGRTAAIIPVHMAGGAADLDRILPLAAARKIPVIEDACQAHLGEWRSRKLGTLGTAGCFSFQASKNLNSGEGGAVAASTPDLLERCYTFHNNGRGRRNTDFSYRHNGANFRLTEFQAALLLSQMTRLEQQSKTRDANAVYLTSLLEKIPGIHPVRNYPNCTRSAWHLFMFRYDSTAFEGAPRETFLRALAAEGVRGSAGYRPLNLEPFLEQSVQSRAYRRLYPAKVLNEWRDRNRCPVNDRLCEQAVWFTQTMLLGSKSDMEQIAEAVAKLHRSAGAWKSFAA